MSELYSNNDWRDYQSLTHFGIPGMKWGVRRYQNKDGSLTAAGRKRYGSSERNAGFRELGGYHGEVRNSERTNNNSSKNEAWRNIKPETDMTFDEAVDFWFGPSGVASRETSGRNAKLPKNFSEIKDPMKQIEENAKKLGKDPEEAKEEFRKSVLDQLSKDYKNAEYDNWGFEESVKNIKPVIDEIKNDKDYVKAVEEEKELYADYNKFSNDRELSDKYAILAGLVNAEMSGFDSDDDKEGFAFWYKYDDGDQGAGNSYALYMLDNGKDGDAFDKKSAEISKAKSEALEKAVNNYMGDHVNDRLYGNGGRTNKVNTVLCFAVEDSVDYWTPVDDMGFGKEEYKQAYKEALEKAKKEYDKYKDV